jgi:hypothetical protein
MQSAYEKLKRHRVRKRNGRGCLTIEIDLGAVGDLLVDFGFLEAWDLEDRAKLRQALEHALAFWSEA